jgi:hypothetical protein
MDAISFQISHLKTYVSVQSRAQLMARARHDVLVLWACACTYILPRQPLDRPVHAATSLDLT